MNEDHNVVSNDIERLHEHLPEIEPGGYFDLREHTALQRALVAWPFLARLMRLPKPLDGHHADIVT